MKLKSIAANQTETETEDGNKTVFYSYETPVAVFVTGKGAFVTEEKYSRTTSIHIHKTLDRWGCEKPHMVPQAQIDKLAER